MNLLTTTPPAEEPLSLETAKLHCRIEGTGSDILLPGYIKAARGVVEAFTRRRLVTQEVQLRLSSFPGAIMIPTAPVQAVTSVSYLDDAGVEQTVPDTDYRLIQSDATFSIIPMRNKTWPLPLSEPDSVRVSCTVGYGAASDVPPEFVVAIQLLVGHYFENREASVVGTSATDLPLGVTDILTRHVVWV